MNSTFITYLNGSFSILDKKLIFKINSDFDIIEEVHYLLPNSRILLILEDHYICYDGICTVGISRKIFPNEKEMRFFD